MKITVRNILWIYAFLIIGLAYIFGLFIDLTGDSGLYAAISRQLVESGDWMNLKINGELYDQKPHLLFWLAGFGIEIFGNTNFAFKIFPAIWGLLGLYFAFRLGKLLFSKEVGKLAALLAGTSQIFALYLFDIHTDTVLQTGVIFALWQLAAYLKNKKIVHFIFGFIGIGLAMFSKGPVGAIVPFFAVFFYLLAEKDYRQLFHPKWFFGIIITLLVISPALIHLYKGFGWEGIQFYFITNNFGRISGEYVGSSNDYLFYFHTILWAFIPWPIFILFAVFSEIKSWFSKKVNNNWGFFLLGGVLVFMFILSIAKGKAPNYFLLAVPILSVLTAKWISGIEKLSKKKRNILFIAQQILIVFLFILLVGIAFIFREKHLLISVVLISVLLLALFISNKKIENKFNRIILQSLLVAGSLFFYLETTIIPELYTYQGARKALEIYENKREENDTLKSLQLVEFELFYWAESPVENFTNWIEFYDFLENEGSWVYTNKSGYEVILEIRKEVGTVYKIPQRGMNELSISFILPKTRQNALNDNYLIQIH